MDTSARPHVNLDPIARLLAVSTRPGWPARNLLSAAIAFALAAPPAHFDGLPLTPPTSHS